MGRKESPEREGRCKSKEAGRDLECPPKTPKTRNIQYTLTETAAETEATKAMKDYEK